MFSINQLDDELVPDYCPNFGAGMDEFTPPQDLAPNQAAGLKDLDLSTSLIMETRPGTRAQGTTRGAAIRAMYFFNTSSTKQLVVMANSKAYYTADGASWSTMGTYAPTTTAPCAMVQALNRLYMSDGAGNVFSWDGTTPLDEANTNTDPPQGTLLLWEESTGRLLVSGVATLGGAFTQDRIYYSDSGAPQTFDRANNYITIGNGDGQALKAWCKWDNMYFVVGRESSTWLVKADPVAATVAAPTVPTPAAWVRTRISDNVGCLAPLTMCQVGKDVYWLTQHGYVTSVKRLYQDSQTQIEPSLSEPMHKILSRLNRNVIGKCNAFSWNNRYFLSIPVDGATECNYVLVFNTIISKWTGYWTNLKASCFARQSFSGDERLVFGDSTGLVKKLMDRAADGIYDDDGGAITTELVTRGFVHGMPQAEKVPANVHCIWYKSTAMAAITIILDQAKRKVIRTGINTGLTVPTLPVVLPFVLGFEGNVQKLFGVRTGPCFMAQYSITTTGGYIAHRGLISNAYMNAQRIAKN